MSVKKQLKVGLIGCGRISERHASVLTDLAEQFRLLSVCDIQEDRLKKIAQKYNCKSYSNHKEMVKNERLDVVCVLSESGTHFEISRQICDVVKNLVVEKPLALKLSHVDELIEKCNESGTELFVVKQNRYNRPVRKLLEALEKKRFGKLISGSIRVRWSRHQSYYDLDNWRGTWRYDGGVITNQASHHIDLLLRVMGPATSVFAYKTTAMANIEVEDTLVAVVKFKNGALGTLEATTATRPSDLEGSISVLGTLGNAEIGGFAVNKIKQWNFLNATEEDRNIYANYSVNPPDVYGFGHKEFYKEVYAKITSGHCKEIIDGQEGRKSLELIHAIYLSCERGKEIQLPITEEFRRLGD